MENGINGNVLRTNKSTDELVVAGNTQSQKDEDEPISKDEAEDDADIDDSKTGPDQADSSSKAEIRDQNGLEGEGDPNDQNQDISYVFRSLETL